MRHTCGSALLPGDRCVITVDFTPSELGERIGAFRIKRADGALRDVWMLGYGSLDGTAEPEFSYDALTLANLLQIGEVPLNSIHNEFFSIGNVGRTPLSIDSIEAVAPLDPAFTVNRSGCPTVLAPLSSCAVSVSILPAIKQPYSATVSVSANQANSVKSIQIEAKGGDATQRGQLEANESSLSFGETPYLKPVRRSLTVSNLGSGEVSIQSVFATNAQNFVVLKSCTQPIVEGGSCELLLEFTAKTPETSYGELILLTKTGQSLNVFLTGKVPSGVLEITPSLSRIPNTAVGDTSEPEQFKIKNIGSATYP